MELDRFDAILDGLVGALNEAVADAVRAARENLLPRHRSPMADSHPAVMGWVWVPIATPLAACAPGGCSRPLPRADHGPDYSR